MLREIVRQGAFGETPRVVLTRLWTYSLTYGATGWMMSLQLDKLPKAQQEWVEENGSYLFSTHEEGRVRNMGKLRHLDDQASLRPQHRGEGYRDILDGRAA